MRDRRLYPKNPMVGVGVLIQEGDRYLLVKRAADPDKGLWSIPGGLVELGEEVKAAAFREAKEETGLDVEILNLLWVVDKIEKDEKGLVKYDFVIVDYLAEPKSGTLRPASDVLDARWVKAEELTDYPLTPTLLDVLKRVGIYPT